MRIYNPLCATAVTLLLLSACATQELESEKPYYECWLWIEDVCIDGEWRNTPGEVMKRYERSGL